MNKRYVQYGCGGSAPKEWTNYDSSPTLRIQRTPVLGFLLRAFLPAKFPEGARYGDIVKGLPDADNSCDGLYCSHVLEHLSLDDFRAALKNSYRVLKPGGLFRLVLPDLEPAARSYIAALDEGSPTASIDFVGKNTLLGRPSRMRGLRNLLQTNWGNSMHLWMWDHYSMAEELKTCGFTSIRKASFHDSQDPMFKFVEDEYRFRSAIAFECSK